MRGGDGLKFPQRCVEWWERKQLPFIELHPFTNLSPPLIRLFYQPVPKYRLIKNPASPRGKPRGGCGSWFHSTNCSLPSVSGRLRRSGRQPGDPLARSALGFPRGGKLLSEARLMRGGDRLVYKCSWMGGICSCFYHSMWNFQIF